MRRTSSTKVITAKKCNLRLLRAVVGLPRVAKRVLQAAAPKQLQVGPQKQACKVFHLMQTPRLSTHQDHRLAVFGSSITALLLW